MKVIYPGSFDPPTLGHVSIASRAAELFERVVVVVAHNPHKDHWFSADKRVELFQRSMADFKNVEVICREGLVAEVAVELEASAIVKGLRSEADFRIEHTMAEANAILGRQLETLFLMSKGELQGISSSLVRQIHQLGGDVSPFVPRVVFDELQCNG
jgi:pantetheine-phosphate adenylyltransferase